jgi:methionine-rich copper-binding protein CopC
MRPCYRFVVIMLFVATALSVGACSDDSEATDEECTYDGQCADDEVCLQGSCVVQGQSQCTTDDDCPSGPYECVEDSCQRIVVDAGDDADPNNNTSPDTSPDPDVSTPDAGQPPYVVSSTPADGATDVDRQISVEVSFSEPMDPVTINFYSVILRDPNNRDVSAAVTYDDATDSATLVPDEPLHRAGGYRIQVNSLARNEAGVSLAPDFEARFAVEHDEPAELTELAEKWAPVIYQGISDTDDTGPNGDIPTLIDFDDNMSAADNGINSRQSSTRTEAHVYYEVIESNDYYFLHYILYYPTRFLGDGQSRAEHDFAAAVFVIDKESEQFLLAEGVRLTDSGEDAIGYKPQGSPMSLPGGSIGDRALRDFDPATFEGADQTRYPMYVPAGEHETCHWHDDGTGARCLHQPGKFRGGDDMGVVLRPGDYADTFEDAQQNGDTGLMEMSYRLVPLATGMWAHRGDYSQEGLFEVPFVYDPQGDERPVGYRGDQQHVLPRRLQSNASTTFGRTPFFWMSSPASSNHGQWLLDPVYTLSNRYNFGESVATDYCYNLFFDIDQRGDASVDGCGE